MILPHQSRIGICRAPVGGVTQLPSPKVLGLHVSVSPGLIVVVASPEAHYAGSSLYSDTFDGPQRMVRWDALVEVDEGEHSGLWIAPASQ